MQFRDLAKGDTFDFIDDVNPLRNSYYRRCVKLSARTYTPVEGEDAPRPLRVGTINCQVFHVERAAQ